jgi:hypothetical protein
MTPKETGTSINAYYIRGDSIAKIQELELNADPQVGVKQYRTDNAGSTAATEPTKLPQQGNTVVKNGIDETILGLWKYHDPTTNKDSYYKLNADGTFDFYDGTVSEANKSKGINNWKIEEGGYNKNGVAIIDFAWATGKGYVLRQDLQKKNDPVTGKPAITLNTTTMLISADNKAPWK